MITTASVLNKTKYTIITSERFIDSYTELINFIRDSFNKYEEHSDILTKSTDDSWFWSEEWQAGERKADEDLKNGRFTEYKSIDDVLKYLNAQKEKA